MKPYLALTAILGAILISTPTLAAAKARGDALAAIDLRNVKVDGEIGRRMALTIEGNLLKIDLDKDFLAPFSGGGLGAGMNDGSGGYVGLGKTLDGIVRLAANTRHDRLTKLKKHAIACLIASQEPSGYIGIIPEGKRTWTLWDIHEQSYIIYALVSDYTYFREKSSLEAARKLGDYLIGRWPTKPSDWAEKMPGNTDLCTVGLKAAFFALYQSTGDKRYLDFFTNELKTEQWSLPIVIGRFFPFDGHLYCYCSHCLPQLDLYRLDPKASLLGQTQRGMDFLLTKDGLGITGGAGRDECWSEDQAGAGNYAETCATAYQIFVYDNLLRLRGDSRWGDIIERTIYNSAFAAQSPDGRQIRYYSPFEGKRVYFGVDGYCCPGNFRRLMAFLPELIYYRTQDRGIAVNLYNTSKATLNVNGCSVALEQKTDYPSSGRVALSVNLSTPRKFALLLRTPRWCTNASASVNGKPVKAAAKPGTFLKIDRTWKPGDKVELNVPMTWRFIAGRKAQAGRAAIMRGPVLYTLNPSGNPDLADIDLKRLVIHPSTIELIKDDSVRPGGTACRVKADLDTVGSGALTLTLQEFPDPDGQLIYFQLADPKVAVQDELLGRIKL